MGYLFEPDAISEVLKPKPLAEYVRWLQTIPIAATAIHHDLELVTGNLRHFRWVRRLRSCTALAEARSRRQ